MALTQVQGGMLQGSTNTTTTIQSNGTTAITINSSQNVGVGTSSPADKLSVVGNVRIESAGYFSIYNADNTTYSQIRDSGGAYVSQMEFYTAGVERMRITNAGDLLVGTTSSTAHKMTVQSAAGAGAIDCVGGSTNGYYAMRVDMPSTNTYGVLFRNNGNNVGDIRVNSSSTAYNTSSDYRLKENIAPMSGALATVSALKPVTYTWKSTGEASQGFIAHELQAVVPDCVTGKKDDVDEEGNPVYQGVDTSFLVATLTAAIQELNAKVEAQAAEIAALKAAP